MFQRLGAGAAHMAGPGERHHQPHKGAKMLKYSRMIGVTISRLRRDGAKKEAPQVATGLAESC